MASTLGPSWNHVRNGQQEIMMPTDIPKTTAPDDKSFDTTTPSRRKRSWRPGNILFGLLLICIGMLFLFENLGLLNVNLGKVWELWPLLIVASGLSLISVRGWLSSTLIAIFIVAALGLVGLVAFGVLSTDSSGETTTRSVEISRENSDGNEARVSINGGAGSFVLNSDEMLPLVKATLKSSVMKLTQKSRTENGNQTVELNVEGSEGRWWGGNYRNDLKVTLNENQPMRLDISTGASSVNADLSDIELRTLNIDSGASKIDIKLGEKTDDTDVSIDAGMSSVKILVPRSSGLRLEIDSPMSSRHIPRLLEISQDTYETENYDNASKRVFIKSNVGMGSFTVEYY